MPSSNNRRATKERPASSPVRYLRCRAEPGMFKDELLVFLSGFDPVEKDKPIKVQLLVDQQEVEGLHGTPKRNQPATGWLRVMITTDDDKPEEGIAAVILPQPAQPVGETLLVDANELRRAAGP